MALKLILLSSHAIENKELSSYNNFKSEIKKIAKEYFAYLRNLKIFTLATLQNFGLCLHSKASI